MCQDALPTAAALREHAQKYHKKNYCSDCGNVYENLRGHRVFEHDSNPNGEAAAKRTRKPRMVRATTEI